MMKNNRKLVMVWLMGVFFIFLAACGNSTDSNTTIDNKSDNTSQNEIAESDSTTDDITEEDETENGNTNETEDTNKEEEDSTNQVVSLKQEYLTKLNDTKKEMDEIEPEDDSTYALKNVEGNRYDVWDGLLNEIYGVLKDQLSTEEMEQVRKEQRNWLTHRDETAKEASLKYEGGTMEQLEYVSVLANLTEERCFELVKKYVK